MKANFINDITSLILKTAPYPSKPLAFCGALSLTSLLVSRKVIFEGMTPNIYILGLANSGSGKNWPRQVISKLLSENGLDHWLGDSFSSGEAIEDALSKQAAMLFLNDEFDTIIRSMASERETRFESTKLMLLKMYTSAGGLYFCRRKASDDGGPRPIHLPSLILFGTCTPAAFYESVTATMMQSGLMARMLVVEAGKRGTGQRPKPVVATKAITDTIQYWRDLTAGEGNLTPEFPQPFEMAITKEASSQLDRLRERADKHYVEAEALGDGAAMACWARAYEHAVKLAMLYACSENCEELTIKTGHVKQAGDFAIEQVQLMLNAIEQAYVESPFDKLARRVQRFIYDSKDGLSRSELLRMARVDSKQFDLVTRTLEERGDIIAVEGSSSGGRRPVVFIRPIASK